MTARAVVVSSRRLLVDAVGALIDERLEVDRVAATSADDLRAAVDADRAILVIIDLESPGDDPARLSKALADHTGRRCGVYDRFTASIAERAFDLGIGVPVSLRSPVDSLVDAFGGTTVTNVVTAVGPTRRDLDRLAELSPASSKSWNTSLVATRAFAPQRCSGSRPTPSIPTADGQSASSAHRINPRRSRYSPGLVHSQPRMLAESAQEIEQTTCIVRRESAIRRDPQDAHGDRQRKFHQLIEEPTGG